MTTSNFRSIFRAQLETDKITKVTECWSDSCGTYQVAEGTDAEGNAITLCNNGFSQWPNYVVTEVAPEIKAFNLLGLKLNKRCQQWRIAEKLASENPCMKTRAICYLAASRAKELSQKYNEMKRELRIY